MYFPTAAITRHSALLWLAGFSGHVASFRSCQAARTEKSQEMWAMRLTRKGHHRKLRAPIRDISDWLVDAGVSDFCPPPYRVLAMYYSSTFRTSTITCCLPRLPTASHDYLLPPTTTCCLPRLPTASHDYLLPPTTTCCLPRLPTASHDYLLPPTTACCLPRLLPASHDCPVAIEPGDRTKL
jgi:hypothetical protein